MHKAGDVRIENVPDATIVKPTDAVIRITRACICGSDLWPYNELAPTDTGRRRGHEAIGIVEAVGADVRTVKPGDVVVMPFAYSDVTCMFCDEGLQTSCIHGGFFGTGGEAGGAQAEALRIPQADGTLFPLPIKADDALMSSLLTLADVMGTGHHAALRAKVEKGKKAAVIGDGAVGLCGVIAAKRLGAEQIIVLGRHPDRIELAKAFGATDVLSERGEVAIERVRALSSFGVHSVLAISLAPSNGPRFERTQLLRITISTRRILLPTLGIVRAVRLGVGRHGLVLAVASGPHFHRAEPFALDKPLTYRLGTPLGKSLVISVRPFGVGIALDHDGALGTVANDLGDLLECLLRLRLEVGLVEIKQDVGRQFDAQFLGGLLDREVLRLALHPIDPENEVLDLKAQIADPNLPGTCAGVLRERSPGPNQ